MYMYVYVRYQSNSLHVQAFRKHLGKYEQTVLSAIHSLKICYNRLRNRDIPRSDQRLRLVQLAWRGQLCLLFFFFF